MAGLACGGTVADGAVVNAGEGGALAFAVFERPLVAGLALGASTAMWG